jgi:DNA-binding Lrp family transcriptional regulator
MADKSYNMKPQDVVVLLQILSLEKIGGITQLQLSRDLNISQSEISESLKRSKYSGLISQTSGKVDRKLLFDFIVYGLPVVFPTKPGPDERGISTAHAAKFFRKEFHFGYSYVWAYGKGEERGKAIQPLYPSVPEAVQKSERLYEYLVIIDILRIGRAREKSVAIERLKKLFKYA